MMKQRILFATFLVVICRFTATGLGQELSLKTIIARIQEQEQKLVNVHVESRYSSREHSANSDQWVDNGGGSIKAWVIGLPGSKLRIESEQRTRWTDRPGVFTADKYIDAYNGRARQVLWLNSSTEDKPYTTKRGQVRAKRGLGFNGFAIGWTASVFGVRDGKKDQRFSEYLTDLAGAKGIVMKVTEEALNGVKCLRIAASAGGIDREVWYLDPNRGYAMMRRQVYAKDGKPSVELNVEALEEVSPGIFYPTKGAFTSYKEDKVHINSVFEASVVTVNNTDWPDDLFVIQWPPGTVIDDKIANVVFTIGDDEATTLKKIREAVDQAEHMNHVGPTSNAGSSSGVLPKTAAMTGQSETRAVAHVNDANGSELASTPLSVIAILVGVIAVVLGIILWKRRGIHASIILMTVCITTLGAVAQPFSVAVEELGEQHLYSCGINATAFALLYYRRPAMLTQLADRLSAGVHWEREVSLYAIKQGLIGQGLNASAFKNAEWREVIKLLDGSCLAIIHTAHANKGHYYVLIKEDGGSILCVDPGRVVNWISGTALGRMRDQFSGNLLLVTRPKGIASTSNTLDLGRSEFLIDIGNVPVGQEELVASLRVKNTSASTATIESAKGSCGCFRGVEFKTTSGYQKHLQSLAEGLLCVRFDRATFGTGPTRRIVLLQLNDGQRREIRIVVQATVVEKTHPQLTWLPERIDLGYFRDSAKQQQLTVLLPDGVSITNTKSSSSFVRVAIAQQSTSSDSTAARVRKIILYVDIVPTQKGPFEGSVELHLSGGQTRMITVPIVGVCTGSDTVMESKAIPLHAQGVENHPVLRHTVASHRAGTAKPCILRPK